MTFLKRLQFLLAPAAVTLPLAMLVAAPALLRAEEPAPAKEQPESKGSDTDAGDKPEPKIEKAEQKAEVSADAQAVLDKVRDGYKGLTALSMKGKVTADIDINGQKNNQSSNFTASYQAPNKFRHEMEKDIVIGSTGEKMFAFKVDQNAYIMKDAPKERVAGRDLPSPMNKILDQQNPAILLAMSPDAGAQLSDGVSKVEKGDDIKIDDTSYTVLKLTGANSADVSILIDPKTNLLRRISMDMAKAAAAGGQDVKKALFTIDYTDVAANPKVENEQFAWAPPEGAKDAAQQLAAGGDDAGGAAALEGKAAPDFTLTGLDGKEVKLKDLKGQVVVLDFWATWCGPCRASLPHLDKLYQATKEKKIKIFAVNLKEDKVDVAEFVKSTKLTVPVLLDADGATGNNYMANAIPETVIIDKDGKVKKVFVGFGGDKTAEEMKSIVEDAAK